MIRAQEDISKHCQSGILFKGRKWTLKIKGERPDPDQVFNKVRDYLGAFKN